MFVNKFPGNKIYGIDKIVIKWRIIFTQKFYSILEGFTIATAAKN
ncbi:hypothetical protein NSP_570 [Nodularia spumigena CCY9414]|nr:hypothetical protein NSP_570 [Nodularia spumigena CCY9414]